MECKTYTYENKEKVSRVGEVTSLSSVTKETLSEIMTSEQSPEGSKGMCRANIQGRRLSGKKTVCEKVPAT